MNIKMKDSYQVTQSNSLIEASYKLTLEEKRLVLIAISLIDSRSGIVPDEITITAANYAKIFDIKVQVAYTQLQEAKDRLYERDIRFRDGTSDARQRWVDRVVYDSGALTLSFSKHLYPYLVNLSRGNFTSYALAQVKPLKSTYSIRIFELIFQYMKEEKRFITIEDLRNILDIGEKYPLYADLRKCVIEPAIKELNLKTILDIKCVPEKKGKTVAKLWFYFTEKKQMDLIPR
jgi:plasmid replication initiation protein